MYALSNGYTYIGIGNDNVATTVNNIKKALTFSEKKKAFNYKDNLKKTLKKFNWEIITVDSDVEQDIETGDEIYKYNETELEKSGFDILDFFNTTIKTISQLKAYANNMNYLEQEYNKKILDVRHYKRDINTKLNAIQLQRLEQFEIKLERERYECKSNRIIAEFFLSDLKRLENINYIDTVKNIKESEYKPKILTYELLDQVVGKNNKKFCD